MATRQEGYPSLTARAHWGRYALGVLVEVAFILALGGVALFLAFAAKAIWP